MLAVAASFAPEPTGREVPQGVLPVEGVALELTPGVAQAVRLCAAALSNATTVIHVLSTAACKTVAAVVRQNVQRVTCVALAPAGHAVKILTATTR
jgi:hypothetical protein